MNIKTILCPIDFSESSENTLRYACSLAAKSKGRLLIVHVFDASPMLLVDSSSNGVSPDSVDKREKEDRERLNRVVPTSADLVFERRFLKGNAENEILALAKREKVDLIVMGSHGRTGLYRMLIGSVAEGVLRRADCPVLIVKQSMRGEDLPLAGDSVSHESQ